MRPIPDNGIFDVFLLTKPPGSPRTDLCLDLVARSTAVCLYLVGDGAYNVLGPIDGSWEVFASAEDMASRGLTAAGRKAGVNIIAEEELYRRLVRDSMEGRGRLFTF